VFGELVALGDTNQRLRAVDGVSARGISRNSCLKGKRRKHEAELGRRGEIYDLAEAVARTR
jgi:hypothetical protein